MSIQSPTRPTWAEGSRSALRNNFALLQTQARTCDAELVAVIKANAYGHGAAEALITLAEEGCAWFAVTCLAEAIPLAERLGSRRLLILSGLFPGEAEETLRLGFTPVLGSVDQLAWLVDARNKANPPGATVRVHLEIDTGMARQGIQWNDVAALRAFASLRAANPPITLEGVMTHFASPEDEQSRQTTEQIERFRSALATLREHGCQPPLLHAGNSASAFVPEQMQQLRAIATQHGSRLLLRPGIALYGYGPNAAARGLKPVLSWRIRITALRTIAPGEPVSYNATFRAARPTRIALLPVGYADGYNRLLSNRGAVLVRGQRAPIAGRVTMDQIMIDVTDIPAATIGDEAILIGRANDVQITADDLATQTGTIAYEVLCAIGARVPRLWRD